MKLPGRKPDWGKLYIDITLRRFHMFLHVFDTNVCMCLNSYSFQTPEAWNTNDQYRALTYMRPLAIWSMQWALTRTSNNKQKQFGLEPELEPEPSSLMKHDIGFSRVSRLLNLPNEASAKGTVQTLFEYACRRMMS